MMPHVVSGRPARERSAAGLVVAPGFFDLALEDDLRTQFTVAIMNTDAASVAEIFTHPPSLIGQEGRLPEPGAGRGPGWRLRAS